MSANYIYNLWKSEALNDIADFFGQEHPFSCNKVALAVGVVYLVAYQEQVSLHYCFFPLVVLHNLLLGVERLYACMGFVTLSAKKSFLNNLIVNYLVFSHHNLVNLVHFTRWHIVAFHGIL